METFTLTLPPYPTVEPIPLFLTAPKHQWNINNQLTFYPHHPYSAEKLNRLGNAILESLEGGDLALYRLDLYLKASYKGVNYPTFMEAFKRLHDRINSKDQLNAGLAFICRTVEWGEDTGFHLHLLLAYRWRKAMWIAKRAMLIAEQWEEAARSVICPGEGEDCTVTRNHRTSLVKRVSDDYDPLLFEEWYRLDKALLQSKDWTDLHWQNVLAILAYFSKEDSHMASELPWARRTYFHPGPYCWLDWTERTGTVLTQIAKLKRARQYHERDHYHHYDALHQALSGLVERGLWYTFTHWHDNQTTRQSIYQPGYYAHFRFKSPLFPDHHSLLCLYASRFPGVQPLITPDDWTELRRQWSAAYTYQSELVEQGSYTDDYPSDTLIL